MILYQQMATENGVPTDGDFGRSQADVECPKGERLLAVGGKCYNVGRYPYFEALVSLSESRPINKSKYLVVCNSFDAIKIKAVAYARCEPLSWISRIF